MTESQPALFSELTVSYRNFSMMLSLQWGICCGNLSFTTDIICETCGATANYTFHKPVVTGKLDAVSLLRKLGNFFFSIGNITIPSVVY